ncbi:MAG: hypothetical protein CM1200mP6_06030 [Anaerolineaceae bacterium]|nr:MAG: hypothetical protein CM1200mP6_06030 [Anaerolineaceae bacterium]
MFVFFVIALIESIGPPRFGFDEIGIDPTVIAEAVPSLAIRYSISRVLARNIDSGTDPAREGLRELFMRANVPA